MTGTSMPPPDVAHVDEALRDAEAREQAARPWGPGKVALGVLALFLTTGFEATVVVAFDPKLASDPELASLAAKLVLQAMLAVTLVGIAFVVAGGRGGGPVAASALGVRRPTGSYIKFAALAYGAYFAFAIVYGLLTNPEQEDITRELGLDESLLGAIAAGVLIVVAAPISEEIFFRGFMFGGLRSRMRFAIAGPLSAVIFGAFHFTGPDSLLVIPQLAFLGLALSWVYERSGSILPTIGVHALNNALAFAILTS